MVSSVRPTPGRRSAGTCGRRSPSIRLAGRACLTRMPSRSCSTGTGRSRTGARASCCRTWPANSIRSVCARWRSSSGRSAVRTKRCRSPDGLASSIRAVRISVCSRPTTCSDADQFDAAIALYEERHRGRPARTRTPTSVSPRRSRQKTDSTRPSRPDARRIGGRRRSAQGGAVPSANGEARLPRDRRGVGRLQLEDTQGGAGPDQLRVTVGLRPRLCPAGRQGTRRSSISTRRSWTSSLDWCF